MVNDFDNEIYRKTYEEILNEIKTLFLIKKIIIMFNLIQILVVYYLFRTHGMNNEIMILYILTIGYLLFPYMIEKLIKKTGEHTL